MNKTIQNLGLLPADRIVVPKSYFRIVEHHVLYIGQNHLGQDLIIENKIGIGVRVLLATDFFKEAFEITRVERFKGNNQERGRAVEKALSKVGLPYDMINYNCQHFANEIQSDKVESDQVRNVFISIAVLLVVGFLLTD